MKKGLMSNQPTRKSLKEGLAFYFKKGQFLVKHFY